MDQGLNILGEVDDRLQLQAYKKQRLPKIVQALSATGLRFDKLLTITELKEIINDEAHGNYDSKIFASIIVACQEDLLRNRNRVTLYQFFDKYTGLEYELLAERERQTAKLTQNSLLYNSKVAVVGSPSKIPKALYESDLLRIQIRGFKYGEAILTDLDEDRFEMVVSSKLTKLEMLLRHTYLEYVIQQKEYPVLELEIDDLNEKITIQMSDLYARRQDDLDQFSEKNLEVRNFLDQKEHRLKLSFENNLNPFQQEIPVEIDITVKYIERKSLSAFVRQLKEELARIKEQEAAIIQARQEAVRKLATLQELFDNETKESANKDFDSIYFSQAQKDTFTEPRLEIENTTIPSRPSQRIRLFARPREEQEDQQSQEDEIYRIYKKIISKVRYINLGYLILSLIISFYRSDFVDLYALKLTIGVAFYAGAKVREKYVYDAQMVCAFICAVVYSILCDFIWLGVNYSLFSVADLAGKPSSAFSKTMMVFCYIRLFYKVIVLLSYSMYTKKHREAKFGDGLKVTRVPEHYREAIKKYKSGYKIQL